MAATSLAPTVGSIGSLTNWSGGLPGNRDDGCAFGGIGSTRSYVRDDGGALQRAPSFSEQRLYRNF
jgi:hypothetical protein